MDNKTATLTRAASADPEDHAAQGRLIAERLRSGERFPTGAIVTLDNTRCEDYRLNNRPGFGEAPRKLKGRWVIQRPEAFRSDSVWLRRVGKKGQILKNTANNTELLAVRRLEQMAVKVEAPIAPVKQPKKVEHAPDGAPMVREPCCIGPCFQRGRLVRETAKFYVIEVWNQRKKTSRNERLAKRGLHLEACSCCTDHPNTCYPYGYWD